MRLIQNPKPKTQNPPRVDVLACMLMLLLAVVFMSPGILPGRVAVATQQLLVFPPWHSIYPDIQTIQTGGDPLLQQLPWRHWAQQEWAAGRFPLWSSSPLGGMPLFASMQPAVLYPLHLLWVLLPIGYGTGVITALKLWLAGVGMWILLRAMGIHPSAALLSSLGFMFGTTMVIWSPWQNTAVYLVLPWIAWAVYNWCWHNRRSALVWLVVLIAIAIFGGHPETLFNMGVVVALWSLGLIVASPRRHWLGKIGGLALAALIGLGLGAIQLLPFLEAVSLSHEAAIRTNANAYGELHLGTHAMQDWVLPRSEGQPAEGVLGGVHNFHETNGYVGLVAIVGLLLAPVAGLKRRIEFRKVVPWVVIGALAWILTYDDAFGQAIRLLPGFNQSLNVRWVWMIGFAALVVSAFGWDWLARAVGHVSRFTFQLVGVGMVALGLVLMAIHASGMIPQPVMQQAGPWNMANDDYRLYWAVWAGGVALAVVGAAMLWARARARWIGPMLLTALLLVDMWSLLFSFVASAPADQYYPKTRFLRDLKNIPHTERVITRFAGLIANSALVYGIRDWRAQDPMISDRAYKAALLFDPDLPKRPGDNYNMVMIQVRLQIAPMLGIRYFVSSRNPNEEEPEPDRPPITRLEYKEGLGLWRIEGVPGFTYLSDNVQMVPDEAAALAWMKGLTWTQVRAYSALVEAAPHALAAVQHDPDGGSPGNVEVEEYTPGHIRLRSNALRPALLVVAESWYPGWRATIDGQPVEVLRANYLSQGVVVPTGSHTVELEYSPDSFRYGLLVSLGALVVLGMLGVLLVSAMRHDARYSL